MEYNRSFALAEAVFLVGLTAWLFYINSRGPSSGSDSKDTEQKQEKEDESGR